MKESCSKTLLQLCKFFQILGLINEPESLRLYENENQNYCLHHLQRRGGDAAV